MKTINLFLKAHFTSLSPDGQFISLAIISDDSKSFYAEFSDFDVNRCDDWVKENVISKLNLGDKYKSAHDSVIDCCISKKVYVNNDTHHIKNILDLWLSKFSDYKINFVVDCGWFCWGKFVELMGEWEGIPKRITIIEENGDEHSIESISKLDTEKWIRRYPNCKWHVSSYHKIGLPKLPVNFPPIPQDLNELIAFKKGITVSEAFELDRYEWMKKLLTSWTNKDGSTGMEEFKECASFNSLWDAKVTKKIYNMLE